MEENVLDSSLCTFKRHFVFNSSANITHEPVEINCCEFAFQGNPGLAQDLLSRQGKKDEKRTR